MCDAPVGSSNNSAGKAFFVSEVLRRVSGRRVAAVRVASPKNWVTSGEVARALNMTDAAIRRWAREGLLAAIKTPGGQYRFRRESLARLLQNHRPDGGARRRKR